LKLPSEHKRHLLDDQWYDRACIVCPVNHFKGGLNNKTACDMCPENSDYFDTGASTVDVCR
jgi:hypothetical protein